MHERTAEWSNSPVKPQRWITASTNVKEARTRLDYLPDFLIFFLIASYHDSWPAKGLNMWQFGRLVCLTGMVTQEEASLCFYLLSLGDTFYFSLAQRLHTGGDVEENNSRRHLAPLHFVLMNTQSLLWDLPTLQGEDWTCWPQDLFGLVKRWVLRA